MYKVPEGFELPEEVKAFQADCEALGVISDGESWNVSEEAAGRFQDHLNKMLPLAEDGNPWAQYNVAVVFMNGYLQTSLGSVKENYQKDCEKMSYWLEKAAKKGFFAAVDNLVTSGVGEESERLRNIFREVEARTEVPWSEEYNLPVYPPSIFEEVWKIA